MKTNAELLDALITEFGVLYPETKAALAKKPAVRRVRTPEGVRKFRQSMGAVIKRDLVPSAMPPVFSDTDFAPRPDEKDAPKARDRVKSHVEDVAKKSKQKRNVGEEDVALKMEANSRLHPIIKAKLQATEAGRAWLASHAAPQQEVEAVLKGEWGQWAFSKTRVKKLRDALIALDPDKGKRTYAENKAEADRLIVFAFTHQEMLNPLFTGYGNVWSVRSLLNSLSRGVVAEKEHITSLDKIRAKMNATPYDPEDAAVERWTRKCIDTWAETAFDHNSLSIAMQATAETLYAEDAYVDRFPHLGGKKELATKVDALIAENAPALVAFVSSVYEETQKSLQGMGVKKVRLYRGMTVTRAQMPSAVPDAPEDPAKKVFNDKAFGEYTSKVWPKEFRAYVASLPSDKVVGMYDGSYSDIMSVFDVFKMKFKEWAQREYGVDPEAAYSPKAKDFGDDGELVKIHLQPLSATATTRDEASQFMHTSGSGTPTTGGIPTMFTMDVPIERIWSIPTHGPGCYGEDEVIVLGGMYTVRAKTSFNDGYDGNYTYDDIMYDQNYQDEYGDIVFAEMKKRTKEKFAGALGDDLKKTSREWYDTIGRFVSDNSYALIGYQKRYDLSQELWIELDKRPEPTFTVDEDWYGFLRMSGVPKMKAIELTLALGNEKSKQPVSYGKLVKKAVAKKAMYKKGPVKKAFVKKAAFKKAVGKPTKVHISDLPNPEKITYDEMVTAFFKTGAKGISTMPKPGVGAGHSSDKEEFHARLYDVAELLNSQGIKPKAKVTKEWIKTIEKNGDWEWSGTDIYPNSPKTDADGYEPPAKLVKMFGEYGYVWSSGMFVIPWSPSMKKKLPPSVLGKKKITKAMAKAATPTKMAAAKKTPAKKTPVKKVTALSQQYFDLGVDAKGKPKALNKFTGWLKQPDGSYRQKFFAKKPVGALVTAMKMHGWTYKVKDGHATFYPPGYKAPVKSDLDAYGKPMVLKYSYGWHKQSDGSFVNTYGSWPWDDQVKAIRKMGWSYKKVGTNGNPTIYPPGHPLNMIGKKTAAKKITPKKVVKKAVSKSAQKMPYKAPAKKTPPTLAKYVTAKKKWTEAGVKPGAYGTIVANGTVYTNAAVLPSYDLSHGFSIEYPDKTLGMLTYYLYWDEVQSFSPTPKKAAKKA